MIIDVYTASWRQKPDVQRFRAPGPGEWLIFCETRVVLMPWLKTGSTQRVWHQRRLGQT